MAVIPEDNGSLDVYISLTNKNTGSPLANKSVTITFRTLEQLIGGQRAITNTKTLTTNNNGIIDISISYDYDFDRNFGVQASFKGDESYKPITVQLTER